MIFCNRLQIISKNPAFVLESTNFYYSFLFQLKTPTVYTSKFSSWGAFHRRIFHGIFCLRIRYYSYSTGFRFLYPTGARVYYFLNFGTLRTSIGFKYTDNVSRALFNKFHGVTTSLKTLVPSKLRFCRVYIRLIRVRSYEVASISRARDAITTTVAVSIARSGISGTLKSRYWNRVNFLRLFIAITDILVKLAYWGARGVRNLQGVTSRHWNYAKEG